MIFKRNREALKKEETQNKKKTLTGPVPKNTGHSFSLSSPSLSKILPRFQNKGTKKTSSQTIQYRTNIICLHSTPTISKQDVLSLCHSTALSSYIVYDGFVRKRSTSFFFSRIDRSRFIKIHYLQL